MNSVENIGTLYNSRYQSQQQLLVETQQSFGKWDKATNSLELDLSYMPFWIWDPLEHQRAQKEKGENWCCFNHLIGLPIKKGVEYPLFPYEYEYWQALFEPAFENPDNDPRRWKHVWSKKAAGMGITEFIMRTMLYLAFCWAVFFRGSEMAIMTGIRMTTAKDIMERMRGLLYRKLKIFIDTNSAWIKINGCKIVSYPAKTPQTLHGRENLSFIFMDEFDFFPESLHEFVLNAIERYFGKSNPYVVLNSTAWKPNGLLEKIEKQDIDKCNYKRIYMLWQKGYGYIYTKQDIELAKHSDSWAREYEGEYRGLKGNLFPQYLLEYAASLSDILEIRDKLTGQAIRHVYRAKGEELTLEDVRTNYKYLGSGYPTSIGIDPAYNSSNFAFVVTKYIDGLIYVVREVELQGPSHEEAIEVCKRLMYDDYPSYHPKLYIDASGVSFIRTLKKEIMDQDLNYHNIKQEDVIKSIDARNGMICCPIPFNKFGDRMNYHLKRLFELGLLRISPVLTPGLWISLQTASYDEDTQKFDKKVTAKNDCYDSFRLACINYKIGNMGVLY